MVQKVVRILLSRGCDDRRGGAGVTHSQLIPKTREGTSDIRRYLGILGAHNQEVPAVLVLAVSGRNLPPELC